MDFGPWDEITIVIKWVLSQGRANSFMCAVSANRSEGDKKLKELHGILSFGISKF
jgi:hypothetical protein